MIVIHDSFSALDNFENDNDNTKKMIASAIAGLSIFYIYMSALQWVFNNIQ